MSSMKICMAACALAVASLAVPVTGQDRVPAGFTSIFVGKTLKGWRGRATLWSVKDGAITADSAEPIPGPNTFLIYEKPLGDFELRFKYRLNSNGNSGLQFRSVVKDEANFQVVGLQANMVGLWQRERYGMLYDEGGRGELALLGQKMIIDPKGPNGNEIKRVVSTVNRRHQLLSIQRPLPEWQDAVVIAYGNHFLYAMNGYLMFDAVDNDPDTPKIGVMGIQAHSGPPMKIQVKDVWLKELTSPPNLEGRFIVEPGPPTPAEPNPRPRADRLDDPVTPEFPAETPH